MLPVPVSASASLVSPSEAQGSHGDAFFLSPIPRCCCRVQTVAVCLLSASTDGSSSSSKKEGPASLVAAQSSITPRVHTWWPCINGRLLQTTHLTWRAGASLPTLKARLVYGRHCMALSFVPRRHFIKLYLPALTWPAPPRPCLPLSLPYLTSTLFPFQFQFD